MNNPQELQSFEGAPGVDPKQKMRSLYDTISKIAPSILARANEPITLGSSFVQTPGGFSGGGLPMNIGVTGVDPAVSGGSWNLMNRQLLSHQGIPTSGMDTSGIFGADTSGDNPSRGGAQPRGSESRSGGPDYGPQPGDPTGSTGQNGEDTQSYPNSLAGGVDDALSMLRILGAR